MDFRLIENHSPASLSAGLFFSELGLNTVQLSISFFSLRSLRLGGSLKNDFGNRVLALTEPY
ncbi:hypothetical protein GNF11_09050 [Nostoc sp. UCD122]|uniref:hypothetical protein n=1 Tax=Nostoc sp. UCD121 TaxID=2681305 RepID=UPI00162885EF|nr:hypothetical protein [Nostoc sp. UCD121]MBC1218670.1 hypothetical protein [Nostoc sp. UCD120]MBC1295129.1 hypothetical protein [Nostoc sp. UCD122]